MRKAGILFTIFFSTVIIVSAQTRMARNEYIQQYKDDAVRDMQKTGVPASITLAQALLESDDGNSPLAKDANNHFGIKCSDWNGDRYIQDDDKKNECFRKYSTALESYDDHSNFLKTRPRYASCFQLPITDYQGWARELKKAGYATNPQYADRLIKIIEENNLAVLDTGGDLPATVSEPVASADTKEIPMPEIKNILLAIEEVDPYSSHKVYTNNGVSYIVVKKSDTYKKISDEFELGLWQVAKYNETTSNAMLKVGQKIYIQPKKRTGKQSFCIVNRGQTLHDIAQEQGIKLKMLCKWNGIKENANVSAGQKLWLKKRG
jgi:LysM repeat protein